MSSLRIAPTAPRTGESSLLLVRVGLIASLPTPPQLTHRHYEHTNNLEKRMVEGDGEVIRWEGLSVRAERKEGGGKHPVLM